MRSRAILCLSGTTGKRTSMILATVRRSSRIVVLASWAFAPPVASIAAEPSFAVELEAGPVWQNKNDVQIPNDANGTRFSLEDLAGSGPWPAARLYFTWDINDRHGLRLLAAPLGYSETGVFDAPVRFAGADYLPGTPTEGTYKFNSWRVGYRYRFYDGQRWRWWVGATVNIRDAKIELRQGGTTSRDTDVGLVPLLHFSGAYRMSPRWRLLLEFEGLAGGPGRIEDVALKFVYDVSKRWSVTGGYRTVEGGADIDELYSFAWFNAAVVSGVCHF